MQIYITVMNFLAVVRQQKYEGYSTFALLFKWVQNVFISLGVCSLLTFEEILQKIQMCLLALNLYFKVWQCYHKLFLWNMDIYAIIHNNFIEFMTHYEYLLRVKGASSLMAKVLTWHVRDLGLSPNWIQFFSVNCTGVKICIYIHYEYVFLKFSVWWLTSNQQMHINRILALKHYSY